MTKLLPCPFCGSKDVVIYQDDGDCPRWVWCKDCECDGPPIVYRFNGDNQTTMAIVIANWNQRKQEPTP